MGAHTPLYIKIKEKIKLLFTMSMYVEKSKRLPADNILEYMSSVKVLDTKSVYKNSDTSNSFKKKT